MDKFEHKLRTTLHTKSVQSIMSRTHCFFERGKQFQIPHSKGDNITTYLRKFQIDRENLNLAKRIMDCQSEHSRDKYLKDWKKNKQFMKVRSNFKPQLYAQSPKIIKIEQIPGHGKLLIKIKIKKISSIMKQLSNKYLYLLKFNVGTFNIIPNKQFLSPQLSNIYQCCFFAPSYIRNKPLACKLIKVIENNMYNAGRFAINLEQTQQQVISILSPSTKIIGTINLQISTQLYKKNKKQNAQNEYRESKIVSENYK